MQCCVYVNYTNIMFCNCSRNLCLHTPVIFFSSATFLLLYICPCPFTPSSICFISIFSSHISFLFCFLYLTHPVPCPVSLHSFPVIAFLSCSKQPSTKGPVHQHLSPFLDCEIIRGCWRGCGAFTVGFPRLCKCS